jgi:hypothetical protein
VSAKFVAAINSMNKPGHYARVCRHQGKLRVEIDRCMLVSFDEIKDLVDGVRSFAELADLSKKRHTEHLGGFNLSHSL